MGKLNQNFINELLIGELVGLLWKVQHDDTLDIEIQENNKINIYYRGSSMFKVVQTQDEYDFQFDYSYCNHVNTTSEFLSIFVKNFTTKDWIESIPYIKSEMDLWLYENKTHQSEFMQVITRDNNYSNISLDTDYFISNMDYKKRGKEFVIDLLGIKWPANSVSRQNLKLPAPAIFKFNYGDQSLCGAKEIMKSFRDINEFMSSEKNRNKIYDDAESQFNQKIKLGLIKGINHKIVIDRDTKPEFILLFANHKPALSELKSEIKEALSSNHEISQYADIKIGRASYFGYGLYADNMCSIDEIIS